MTQVFVLMVVCVLTLGIGGAVAYKLEHVPVRVVDAQLAEPMAAVTVPPEDGGAIDFAQLEVLDAYFCWISVATVPHYLPHTNSADLHPVLIIALLVNGIDTSNSITTDAVGVDIPFSDIIPSDAYGVPIFGYSSGNVPTDMTQVWIEYSDGFDDNLKLNWQALASVNVSTNRPVRFTDSSMTIGVTPTRFYRTYTQPVGNRSLYPRIPLAPHQYFHHPQTRLPLGINDRRHRNKI